MRQFILTVVTFLILITNLPGQWEILNQGITGSLNTIDFVTERIGWIGGSDGLLLKTEDGGQTWISMQQNGNWNLRLIDFIDESLGWAAVDDGTTGKRAILKTTDGGQAWQIQREANDWLASLFVVNQEIVYAVGNYSRIIKTTDGGVGWKDISPNNENRYFNSVWFVNSDTGFVAGSFSDGSGYSYALILKTEDSGASWSEKIDTALTSIRDLQLIDDSTGFFWDGTQLCKTDDAFETTTCLYTASNSYSYHALNRDTVYIVTAEGGVGYSGCGCTLKKTTDGGQSWDDIFFRNWYVDKIYFCNPQVGFLCGGAPYGGTIYRTVDSGTHWEQQLFSYPFRDVQFLDTNNGFACGGLNRTHFTNGNILVTHDSGENWEVILNAAYVQACLFVNNRLGFASVVDESRIGYLLRTTDGGISWTDSPFFDGHDLFLRNENDGWAVGRYMEGEAHGAGIMVTTDSGVNWELAWKYPAQNDVYSLALHSIQFIDSTTGWAVGDNGLIVKCVDGQHWERQTSITTLPLNKVLFTDTLNGFIAGGYLNWDSDFQTILIKTSTSGATWDEIPDLPILIHDLHFQDQQHGWAVGTDEFEQGAIMETHDGGENWAMQVDSLIGSLNALSYRDGYLWAVGDYGLVLRTEVDSTTGIDEQHVRDIPASCELIQNYPNPFNPCTAISYRLSEDSFIELSIYNLLGQKVATLVSERQSAGIHKFNWDARGLASGVYLYRLEAGDPSTSSGQISVQAKKLILMR